MTVIEQMYNPEQKYDELVFGMLDSSLNQAEQTLSTLNDIDIQLTTSAYGRIELEELHQLFDQQEHEMVAVSQRIQGDEMGHIILMMSYQVGMELIRKMLKENARLKELTQMEEEAVMEMGNIIINACVKNMLEDNQQCPGSQLPSIEREHFIQIMEEYIEEIDESGLFYTRVLFTSSETSYPVYLFWTRAQYVCGS